MSDGDLVESGNVVVAAGKNGTEMERSYNYYTVDKIKNEVNIETKVNGNVAKLYDSDDTLSVSAEFKNYTNDDTFTAKMYTAQYRYGELIKLWETDSKTVAAGQTETFICDFAGMTDSENSSIKVLVVDEDFNPYIKSASMRFNRKDTTAKVYLVGDSIVQSYNTTYPIQGWGHYIGDYLNDNITVENRATSGWTTDHYLYPDGVYTRTDGVTEYGTELTTSKGSKKTVGESQRYKIWSNIKSELQSGDYVIISLGINDSGSGNVPAERYLENITTMYNDATAKGATVIFTTPTISGREWDNAGGFSESWGGRGKICADFAATNDAICLPLGATLVKTYNNMANEYLAANPDKVKVDAYNYVRNHFHMYPSNGTAPEGWDDFGSLTSDDSTHHNLVASNEVASIIAKLILESDSSLADYVVIPD